MFSMYIVTFVMHVSLTLTLGGKLRADGRQKSVRDRARGDHQNRDHPS